MKFQTAKKKKHKNEYILFSTIILLIIVVLSVGAPIFTKYGPEEISLTDKLSGPTMEHFFGTDLQGRDLFSRVCYGGRIAIISPILVVVISSIFGIILGLLSGYTGGKVDNLIMRICDVVLSFPVLLLALITVSVFGRGIMNSIIILSVFYIPLMAKMVRADVIVQKEQNYIEACKAMGYSKYKIVCGQILPNCISTIIVQATLNLGYAMLDLAALSFLGLGVQPPGADWGTMIADGRQVFMKSPGVCLAPGVALMLVIICFNLLGEGLQIVLDPKRKRG